MINVVSLTENQTNNLDYTNTQSQSNKWGMEIKVGLISFNITAIYKNATSGATRCFLHSNNSPYNGANLSWGTYSGNKCAINYQLNASTHYVVSDDNVAASFNEKYRTASPGFPINNTYIQWTRAVNFGASPWNFYTTEANEITGIEILIPGGSIVLDGPISNTYTGNTTPKFTFIPSNINRVDLIINDSRYGNVTNPTDIINSSIIANSSLTIGREYIWRLDYNSTDGFSYSSENRTFFLAGEYPVLAGFSIQNACYVTMANNGYYIGK